MVFFIQGCIGNNFLEVSIYKTKKTKSDSLNITVSNVQVINHQIIITGTNLTAVSDFKIKEGSSNAILEIESKTSTSIVANSLSNVNFAAGKVFDFIFSSAQAASTFTVNFSLCDSTLGGKGFNCAITPNDKEVLSYDAGSGKWKPRSVNGLSYQGAWDATTAQPSTSVPGDYFIVSVADTPYEVGDWIVFNGTTFDRIDNSQMIVGVFGRTGAVSALEGDYDLTKLSDVTITAPATNQVLTYNGSTWVNGAVTYTELDPLVSAFAKAALPTCGAGQVLKGDGTNLSCVAVGSTFSGTANRAIVTDGSGALAVSAITNDVLGYLSGASSNIQVQLNAKLNSSSFVDWASSGVQTIDPSRINLTTASRVIVTNATSNPTASLVTSTELGYLSGATSSIQTQLSNKQDSSALASDVRGIVLTGLSTSTNAAITAADSILIALGKIQKQISDLNLLSPSVTCPTGYALVPASTTYFTKQFCVAKYEMKNDGYGTAVSIATGTPWTSITRSSAREMCKALGYNYDLISNDQWQTIARNIASTASNWSSGIVADGELNRGHSDNAPASNLAAVADDDNACSGTGQSCSSTVWNSQRRTHVLSNGNIVWDFAGNVSDWITNYSNAVVGAEGYVSAMTGGDIRQTRYGADTATICSTPSVSPFCGMGKGYFNSSLDGGVFRGGYRDFLVSAGVFTTGLNASSNYSGANIGFRCVFIP